MWIQYDECTVKGWYCQCKSGTRVVGTCAHVAATIWYLGFARYHSLKFDSRYDWSVHLKDASETEPHLIDNEVDDIEELSHLVMCLCLIITMPMKSPSLIDELYSNLVFCRSTTFICSC